MAKSKRTTSRVAKPPANGRAAKEVARTSARATASGPAGKPGRAAISDAATQKLAGTEQLAAAFPFNAAKPSEFGDAAATPTRTDRRAAGSDGRRQHAHRDQRLAKRSATAIRS